MGLSKQRAKSAVRDATSPPRRAGCAVVLGVALLAFALSSIASVIAVGFVGLAFVAYGLLFVDVDSDTRPRRMRR